ncbi:MAG: 2'-5' RNA ligase family protein [Gaiellaceae bacterium]
MLLKAVERSPPHVTLVIPFVPPSSIDSSLVQELTSLFDSFGSFAFVLRTTARFPDVLYLAPDPADPLVRLIEAVIEAREHST